MAYAPIQNPVYVDATEWPYIKGPNYTRPVFREHSRQGNFVVQPIIRMPALNGLGCMQAPGSPLDILGRAQGVTYKGAAGLGADPPAGATPEGVCALVKEAGEEAYGKCLSWNRDMAADLAAHPDRSAQYTQMITQAEQACAKQSASGDVPAFERCFYGTLVKEPWYKNPYYLAGAIAGGAAAIALLVAKYRGQQ